MALRNTSTSWGWLARSLHWAMVVIIVGLLCVGLYMVQWLGNDSNALMARYDLTQDHKSWGFVAFVLGLIRIGWRLVNPTPELPDTSAFMRTLAHGGHFLLYACMIAMPVSGWLMASASPYNDTDAYFQVKNVVFGLFELPDPYPKGDEDLTKFLGQVHFYTAMALIAVLLAHVAAALKHHFLDQDGILMRMIRG